eukprot:TRINITY_DN35524_c0_g1_i1.p1 TRINITY_DN35524_c0_g1~~TRINITY_DN35524_c0_g1_i1.p1  ORF type:complete len:468 (+),score=126.29 TRINITY_DN35524_c0_g1_i1:74-1477(+)
MMGGAGDEHFAELMAELAKAMPDGLDPTGFPGFGDEPLEELVKHASGDKTGGVGRELGKRWFDSARCGDFVTMKELLPLCPDLINYRGLGTSYGFIGSTTLHWAAARGHLAMMRWLLAEGADASAQNFGGSTPLHSACSNGQMQSLELLLASGANTTLVDCCGDLCEEVAAPEKATRMRTVIGRWRVGEKLRRSPPEQWKVRDMREALRTAGVDTRGMTERHEMVEQVQKLIEFAEDQAPSRKSAPAAPQPEQLPAADADKAQKAAEAAKDKGNKAYRDGDAKGAVRCYTLAISLWPHDASFYSNRAAAYMSLRRFRLALDDGSKAVELRPEWPKGHYRRGCAMLQLGQAMDAVWALNTAVKLSDPPTKDLLEALQFAKAAVEAEQGGECKADPSSDSEDEPPRAAAQRRQGGYSRDSSPDKGRDAGVEGNLAGRFPHVPAEEIRQVLERNGWHGGRAAQELRKYPK